MVIFIVVMVSLAIPSVLSSDASNLDALASLSPLEPFDAVWTDEGAALNRSRRQIGEGLSVAVPDGAIISIAPRFGWLLYQGEADENDEAEELDLVFQSEFLYHFPATEEEESHDRSGRLLAHKGQDRRRHFGTEVDADERFLLHRNKRMVRDKKLVYSGLQNVFNIMGLDGRACLLRAICEVTTSPLIYDGVVGELLNMALVFLTDWLAHGLKRVEFCIDSLPNYMRWNQATRCSP